MVPPWDRGAKGAVLEEKAIAGIHSKFPNELSYEIASNGSVQSIVCTNLSSAQKHRQGKGR